MHYNTVHVHKSREFLIRNFHVCQLFIVKIYRKLTVKIWHTCKQCNNCLAHPPNLLENLLQIITDSPSVFYFHVIHVSCHRLFFISRTAGVKVPS